MSIRFPALTAIVRDSTSLEAWADHHRMMSIIRSAARFVDVIDSDDPDEKTADAIQLLRVAVKRGRGDFLG